MVFMTLNDKNVTKFQALCPFMVLFYTLCAIFPFTWIITKNAFYFPIFLSVLMIFFQPKVPSLPFLKPQTLVIFKDPAQHNSNV